MDKFIYSTDWHLCAQPRNRKDDYNEAILKKARFILEIARKNGLTVILGGDLFDTPKSKITHLVEVFKLFAEFRDLPIYTLRGNNNHDGTGNQSPLSLLAESGLVIVPSEPYIDFNHTRVIFAHHGFDYSTIKSLTSVDKCCILSTHSTIVKESVPYEHTLIDDFQTSADVILLAHYHPYQGIFFRKSDNRLFIGPGALARKKKCQSDMSREPKCVVVAVNEKLQVKTQEITIPHEKDVWLEKTELEEEIEESHIDIANKIEQMKLIIDEDTIGLSLKEYMEFYAKKTNTDTNVLNFCLGRI